MNLSESFYCKSLSFSLSILLFFILYIAAITKWCEKLRKIQRSANFFIYIYFSSFLPFLNNKSVYLPPWASKCHLVPPKNDSSPEKYIKKGEKTERKCTRKMCKRLFFTFSAFAHSSYFPKAEKEGICCLKLFFNAFIRRCYQNVIFFSVIHSIINYRWSYIFMVKFIISPVVLV